MDIITYALGKKGTQQAVTDYLDEHLTNPTNPPIDTSLTIAGAAADAKATGGKIDELKSGLSAITDAIIQPVAGANKFNPDTMTAGYRVANDGTITESSTITVSDYIEIPTGVTYALGCARYNPSNPNSWSFSYGRMAFYDASKVFILPWYNSTTSAVQIPTGAKYVRVDFPIAYSNMYMGFSNDASLPTYEEYGVTYENIALVRVEEVEGEVGSLGDRVTALENGSEIPDGSITEKKLSFAQEEKSANLFNYQSEEDCIKGYWYYSTSIGSIVTAQSNQYTGNYTAIKANIEGAEEVTIKFFSANPARVYWVGIVDADMRLLFYQTVGSENPVTLDVPDGAVYFLASIQTTDTRLSEMMVSVGGEPSEFVPYSHFYLLKNCKAEITETGVANLTPMLKLPSEYALVVGDTFELFYKGIIDAMEYSLYNIEASCSIGSPFSRKFVCTPTSSGTYPLMITVKDYADNILAKKIVNLVVSEKATSPSVQKNILCVGDSLTTGGVWVKELHRRLTASDGSPVGDGLNNINFIGSRRIGGVGYEGYGGWTFESYNTANVNTNVKIITCTHDKTEAEDQHSIYKDANNATWKLETIESGQIRIIAVSSEGVYFPTTGTLTWVSGGINHSDIVYSVSVNGNGNPFWNTTTGKVDFASYAQRQGVSTIDYVYVLLGWNGASINAETSKQNAQIFIDNVHADFPNAQIVLIGLEVPARDGLGINYGANTGMYSIYWDLLQYVFNLDEWYKEIASTNNNVYHVNLSGQFDTEYNMPVTSVDVNVRNTTKENRQSNGVHPAPSGYMQIADAVYRDITARL